MEEKAETRDRASFRNYRAFVSRLNALSAILFDPGLRALSRYRGLRWVFRIIILQNTLKSGRDEWAPMLTGFNKRGHSPFSAIALTSRPLYD